MPQAKILDRYETLKIMTYDHEFALHLLQIHISEILEGVYAADIIFFLSPSRDTLCSREQYSLPGPSSCV